MKFILRAIRYLGNIEEILFFLITVLNACPLFVGKFIPSGDGAAHLYNSNIINQLLFGKKDFFSEFFIFNPFPVPNWTGHFILSLFNLFLPAFMAEKILIGFYLFGLPYSFRAVIRSFNSENMLLSYLIFPFVYSYVFLLGMYNFSIAIVFMFITISYYIRNKTDLFNIKNVLVLFVLFMLTYFSHLLIFIILIITIGFLFISDILVGINLKNISWKLTVHNALAIVLASIIPLVLAFIYFYSHHKVDNGIFLDKSELIAMLKNLRSIIVYSFPVEETYTTKIVYVIGALLLIIVFKRINMFVHKLFNDTKQLLKNIKSSVFQIDVVLIISIILLVLYFTLPDSDGSAGYVSVRLALLFFIFISLWIALNKIPKWLATVCVLIVISLNFMLVSYYSNVIKNMNTIANQCVKTSEFIKDTSIVLPLYYFDHWLTYHFSNYLAIDKPIVVLENYESRNSYFPLRWNNYSTKGKQFLDENACNTLHKYYNLIDYVFILGDISQQNDSCSIQISRLLKENYIIIHKEDVCTLWKNKSK